MADALASGASVRKDVGVQVPPRAPKWVCFKIPASQDCCSNPMFPMRIGLERIGERHIMWPSRSGDLTCGDL
jgi:hypothetical protein